MFKETLTNIIQHAQATAVTVRMRVEDDAFELRVSDNGRGFDPAPDRDPNLMGDGLKNLRARSRDLSGTCEIASKPGTGTHILLRIPLRTPTP